MNVIKMLLESSVLMVVAQLAVPEQNCTEGCSECINGTCLSCINGYYGRECNKTCLPNCKTFGCSRYICPFGCADGWYRLQCDTKCDAKCKSGRCEQFAGTCYDSDVSECLEGVCTSGCQHYCPKVERRDQSTDDATFTFAWVAFFLLVSFSCCTCCYRMRNRRESTEESHIEIDTRNIGIDIVPSNQRLLPGQQQNMFASSNTTHNHAAFHSRYIDSNNVLTNANCAPSEDTFMTADILSPRCEGVSDSPPSYNSLFKQTAPSSSISASSQ